MESANEYFTGHKKTALLRAVQLEDINSIFSLIEDFVDNPKNHDIKDMSDIEILTYLEYDRGVNVEVL